MLRLFPKVAFSSLPKLLVITLKWFVLKKSFWISCHYFNRRFLVANFNFKFSVVLFWGDLTSREAA